MSDVIFDIIDDDTTFDVVITDQTVDIVTVEGPRGPSGQGDLSPGERQAIVDDAETEVLDALEPPVTLTVLLANSLA